MCVGLTLYTTTIHRAHTQQSAGPHFRGETDRPISDRHFQQFTESYIWSVGIEMN